VVAPAACLTVQTPEAARSRSGDWEGRRQGEGICTYVGWAFVQVGPKHIHRVLASLAAYRCFVEYHSF
jgi:hypothetical protein